MGASICNVWHVPARIKEQGVEFIKLSGFDDLIKVAVKS